MAPVKAVPPHIKSLTDQELANRLQEHNYPIGPILPTTRGVYERKLYQLETGQTAAPTTSYAPADDDDEEFEGEAGADADADEDSVDEEQAVPQHQPRQRTTRSTRPEMHSPRKPSPRRPLHADRVCTDAAGRRVPTNATKSLIPLWVKLLAIVVVAGMVFLVIRNLEAQPPSDIPEQIEVNV